MGPEMPADHATGRSTTTVKLRTGASTSAGRVRTNNQDRFLIIDNRLFVVADGMGGHVGGEVAAQLTVETLARLESGGELLRTDAVVAQVEKANIGILTRATSEPDLRGMGTTLAGIAVVEGDNTSPALLLVLNVGDSRTYWLRGGELEQLSEDHSVVGELQREGKLSAVDARTHKSRSVLTRALGVEQDVECDILEIVPIVGDRFLICSDGLPTELSDQTIAATLRQLRDPQEAAAALVREAVDHGGRDNVTVIVVDVVSGLDGSGVDTRSPSPTRREVPTGDGSMPRPVGNTDARRAPTKRQPTAPRRPWLVNVRVLLFLACLAVIAGVVVWTVQNAPSTGTEPPSTQLTETTLPALTLDTTIASGETTAGVAGVAETTSSTLVDASAATGDTVTLDSGVEQLGAVSDPVPGAVVDPFATTTTTPVTTTRTGTPPTKTR